MIFAPKKRLIGLLGVWKSEKVAVFDGFLWLLRRFCWFYLAIFLSFLLFFLTKPPGVKKLSATQKLQFWRFGAFSVSKNLKHQTSYP